MKLMSDNINTIAKALVAAQKEMGNAVKDSKNPFFKSKYADLNAVREAVLPSFNKHGISVLQPTVYLEGKKFVQTMLIHESGEHLSALTEILSAKELDAQAQGSGISYARRYGLQSFANVGAEDDDGESAMGRSSFQKTSGGPLVKEQVSSAVQNSGTSLTEPAGSTNSYGKSQATATVVNQAPSAPTKKSFRKTKVGVENL